MNSSKLSFWHFFTLWLGAAISIAEILAGGILAPLGFSLGITAILLGHLLGTGFLLLAAYIGFQSKLPAIISTQITFGTYGSRIFSFFNLLQLIGWTAIMILSASQSLEAISQSLWQLGSQSTWTIVVGTLILLWTWLGPNQGWKKINHITVGVLLLLTFSIIPYLFESLPPSIATTTQENELPFMIALELSIAMPLSWVPLIADYTRYGKSAKGAIWGSGLGYFLGSTWMYIIGLSLAFIAGNSDLPTMMLGLQLGVTALGIILLSALTTTFLDVYSAGINLTYLVPVYKEKYAPLTIGVLGTLLALNIDVYQYEYFLLTIGGIFAPLFTVLFTDYFLFRRTRPTKNLRFNFTAIISWIIGISFYYYLIQIEFPWGATLPTLIVTFLIHSLIGRFLFCWYKKEAYYETVE